MLLTLVYISFFLLPALAWFCLVRREKFHIELVSLFSIFASSGLLVGAYIFEKKKEERELYKFDLNGDYLFSDEEMTPEAKEAMDRWATDAGRMFIPLSSVIVSAVWHVINFVTLYILTPLPKAEPDDGINSVTSLRDSTS